MAADSRVLICTASVIIRDCFSAGIADAMRSRCFVLKGMETLGNVEFIVFDRNGHELYKNNHYDNDWDGKDRNGKDLPEDTYFVVIKADNGVSVSSYVVIRR